MDMGSKIPWLGGSRYHGQVVRYTMEEGSKYSRFDIPGVGVKIALVGGQMYHGNTFDIPWVECQNTMGREFNIQWIGGCIRHE